MKRLPFYPLFKLLQVVYVNGGISRPGTLHIFTWLIKTILIEPFRWIELLLFERTVNKHEIKLHPVFILGHYRSGTTYLQRLMAQDYRLGYMSIFQSVLPEILLAFEGAFTRAGEIIVRIFNVKNPFHRIPFTWKFTGEDDVGMTALLSSHGAQWGMLFPMKLEHYFRKYIIFEEGSKNEKSQWKDDYMYLLKKLSVKNRGKRLVLKSPPNTARIKELLELFPEARFVFIHRNPYEVYASTKHLWSAILDNYVLGAYVSSEITQKIIYTYGQMMQRYLEQRAMIPQGRLIEIAYLDLVNEPVSTMKKIYSQIGIDDFHKCKQKVEAFARQQQGYKQLQHSLDEEEQLKVKECWRRYFEEWNYV